ncbi:hypothetical protein ACFQ7F_36800 [Streptomyces sp. NPDC056486]|uniref:hypothetical protein n=1 Tax=Streptomyces sp. NPDC056486 TaxID=3345835 RepID=UPI00368D56AD
MTYEQLRNRLAPPSSWHDHAPTLVLDPTCPFTSAIAAIETWFGGDPARERLQVAEDDTRALLTRAAAEQLSAEMIDDRAEADFDSASQLLMPGTPHYLWRQYRCSRPECTAEHVFAIVGARGEALRCPVHPEQELVPV